MLSLSMVVKNEIQTIERTIQSVNDYVDEIVVGLDTHSSDGTREIVEKLADKVIDIHLTDELAKKGSIDDDPDWGFSKARNAVFDACEPENWRLVLDGHETILNPNAMDREIEKAIKAGCDGIEIWMHFEPPVDGGIPVQMFATSRFMAPSVRYQNAIHNVPYIAKTHVAHNIQVEHRKADQATKDRVERDQQRSDSNIKGLQERLRINSGEARSWFYLATAYKENGRYEEAVKAFAECLKFSVWNEERWHSRHNSGVCYTYLGENEKAREQFTLALEEFPVMAEAYYCLANLAYKQERFREAEVWIDKCLQLELPHCKLFVNPRTYMVDRYDLASMIYDHIGQYDKAVEQAEKALSAEENERIAKNVRIWKEHLNGRPD